MSLDVAVAFCVFNRPKPTQRVFESIRKQRPKRLLIIGDGPRSHVAGEHERVQEVRRIVNQIDWPCDVQTNFSDENLGCRLKIATGITWAFDQAEELIILEDDCLPSESFYGFCRALLQRYRHDDRIMMVSGNNFQPNRTSEYSYYFSRWAHIWGWASWRRAWNSYDLNISNWPGIKAAELLNSMVDSREEADHWTQVFDQVHRGEIDTWDFSWVYTLWANHGLAVMPETNLVSNIGFGDDATHTIDPCSPRANLIAHEIERIQHPPYVCRNLAADRYTFESIFRGSMEPNTMIDKSPQKWIRRILPSIRKKAA